MSLLAPKWYFNNHADNYQASPSSPTVADFGTAVDPGTSNADSTPVTAMSALAFDAHYLVLSMNHFFLSGAACHVLLDVMLDPAGGTSWATFIDDLVCGFTAADTASYMATQWYHFPIFIKAGTSIGLRARCSHSVTINLGTVGMNVFGNPSRPEMWWCGQKAESLGINAATSKGTNVVPGSSGTFGSWASMGTSTARYGAVQYGLNGVDSSTSALAYHFQIGHGSTEFPGAPMVHSAMGTTETNALCGNVGPIFCDEPAGTIWQMRATCGSGGPETFNAAIYGVY